jgi:hypothetical protein
MMKLPKWNPFYSTRMFGALKYLVIAWPFAWPFYSSANIAILCIAKSKKTESRALAYYSKNKGQDQE